MVLQRPVKIVKVIVRSLKKNIENRVRKEVDSAAAVVENQVHDVILTAMDSAVMPKVESAVRSMTGL